MLKVFRKKRDADSEDSDYESTPKKAKLKPLGRPKKHSESSSGSPLPSFKDLTYAENQYKALDNAEKKDMKRVRGNKWEEEEVAIMLMGIYNEQTSIS